MIRHGAEEADFEPLSELWHAGWHDAHAAHVPPELTKLRSREDFDRRLRAMSGDLLLSGPVGAPRGFAALRGDELYQFFVSSAARGTGVAQALIHAAELELHRRGYREAHLDCIAQNRRALRFYAKSGWQIAREARIEVDTSQGGFELPVLVLTRNLETIPT